MAVSTAQLGDICITTQVISASKTQAALPGQTGSNVIPQKKTVPAKAFSPVLILIGVLQLSIGTSLSAAESNSPSLVVRSGVYIWGGLAFIAAGIITVVTATQESLLRIKVCLVSHVINATVAALGVILYSVQLHTETRACWISKGEEGSNNDCIIVTASATNVTPTASDHHHPYSYYEPDSSYVAVLRVAVSSVVLLYILVGLIISGCIILLRWKALKISKYALL